MLRDQPVGVPMIMASTAGDFVTLLRRQGIDAGVVAARAGIDIKLISDPYQRIRLDQFTHFADLTAVETNTPELGLALGLKQDPARWGAFGYLVLNSPTVGAALGNIASAMKAIQDGTNVTYRREEDAISIAYSIIHPMVEHKICDAEFSMAYVKNVVDRLCEHGVTPARVCFEHEPMAPQSVYHAILGVYPYFSEPVNSISYPRMFEDTPVPAADLQLYPILLQHMKDMINNTPDGADLVGTVEHNIRRMMPNQGCTLQNVARALVIEPRTLQRRLKQQGKIFAELLEGIRKQQATSFLLETSMEVKEISYLLGYSDTAAFSKAFKKWEGMTPGQYRAAGSGLCGA